MIVEQERLKDKSWKKWGPYVSDRQWGTVREDYSANGDAWDYTTHDGARSLAYRWGEEGIGGFCDDQQRLCFAWAFWNKKDPILKERYFGLSGPQGNHGEDVKELYYYLDATPTHSYQRMLYKYPQQAYPYQQLINENAQRDRATGEYELLDTGIFDEDRYFDINIEYAKANPGDLLIQLQVTNRGPETAALVVLPHLWFRNTWAWEAGACKPLLSAGPGGSIQVQHEELDALVLCTEQPGTLLFCENETNAPRLYGTPTTGDYYKDGINDYVVDGNGQAVNKAGTGTRAAVLCDLEIGGGETKTLRFRLCAGPGEQAFADFDRVLEQRKKEADEFYEALQKDLKDEDAKAVQRQAFAGMLWNKQYYFYNITQWLEGDATMPAPPPQRKTGRNSDWRHMNCADVLSMPDKWEYPWFAAWDLAFHCIPLAMLDPAFAKRQLLLLTKEWYMHPNGQLPAYEWSFNDANPPVHAWAAWRVYTLTRDPHTGKGDLPFLESVFHKLMLNFTWWVNRKDAEGNNVFEGGFLGLDNIGVFDRSASMPAGVYLEQADATSWMAMYALNLMRIALELSLHNPVYQSMAIRYFEHFLYIAWALSHIGEESTGLWDETDQFFYDLLKLPQDGSIRLKVRSMVGLIPFFAVEVLDHELLQQLPDFARRLEWILEHRPELASLVSRWQEKNVVEKHLLSLLRGHRMKKLLLRMLDEQEFLSPHGVRALSKYHAAHPYELELDGRRFGVRYVPGESDTGLFGGNSNWRGPVWMPVNFLIIESLQRFHYYYGNDFKVECPTGSGRYLSLNEISDELAQRLTGLFLRDANGNRPAFGENTKLQQDPHFRNYLLFFEYFHGDSGKGLGASHQTGWTGLIAKLLQPRPDPWYTIHAKKPAK